jgi:hypothetical protein
LTLQQGLKNGNKFLTFLNKYAIMTKLIFLLAAVLLVLPFLVTSESNCVIHEICKVGIIYSSVGVFAPYSLSGLVVANMYVDHINRNTSCGIGNLGIGIELVKIDVFSNSALVPNATISLCQDYGISVLLLPEGPLASIAATISERFAIPSIAGMSGVQSLFIDSVTGQRRFPHVMGVMTPAPLYSATFLQLFRSYNYETIAVISTNTSPDKDVCGNIPSLAIYNKMKVVSYQIVDSTLPDSLNQAILNTLPIHADILFTCVSLQCSKLFELLKKYQLNGKAHGTFECLNAAAAAHDTFDSNLYTISPVQWNENVFGQHYKDVPNRAYGNMFPYIENDPEAIPSPMQFYLAYQKRVQATGGNPPMSSLSASQGAAFYVIDYAVTKSNSTDPQVLFLQMQSINIKSFFGLISVDENGQNSNREIVQRQALNSSFLAVVSPILYYPVAPMPTYSEQVFVLKLYQHNYEKWMIGFSFVLTIFSLILGFLLVLHRERESIKAISLTFALIKICGCIIMYWAHTTWLIFNSDRQCSARIPVWLLGFTLLIAPITATSYRIHRIVNNNKLCEVVKITDSKLFLYMMRYIGSGALLILLWCTIQPLELNSIIVDPLRPILNYTDCQVQSIVFPVLLVIYITIMINVALYYGVKVRKIGPQYQQFNNARLICVLMFVVGLLTLLGSLIQYNSPVSLRKEQYLIRSTFSMGIALCAEILFFYDILVEIIQNRHSSRNNGVTMIQVQHPTNHFTHQAQSIAANKQQYMIDTPSSKPKPIVFHATPQQQQNNPQQRYNFLNTPSKSSSPKSNDQLDIPTNNNQKTPPSSVSNSVKVIELNRPPELYIPETPTNVVGVKQQQSQQQGINLYIDNKRKSPLMKKTRHTAYHMDILKAPSPLSSQSTYDFKLNE